MSASDIPPMSIIPGTSQDPHRNKRNVLPPLTSRFPRWSKGEKLEIVPSYGFENEISSSPQKQSVNEKVNKKGPELAAIGRSEGVVVTPHIDPLLRVTQLEQNVRFLQEQHQVMLANLHQEIETLRQRNRDLQFQLVFTKGGVSIVQSSPSSPEDDGKPKIVLSPKQINTTPLQVEILEKEIAELKVALTEAKTKNLQFNGIIEEQKKKIDLLEHNQLEVEAVGCKLAQTIRIGSQDLSDSKSKPNQEVEELTVKLDESENLIRRLRRDNDDMRRELMTLKSNKNFGGNGNRQLGSTMGRGGSSGGGGHHRSQQQRFPPLHTQSYWHRGGSEFVSHRHCGNNGGSRLDKDTQVVGRTAPTLPHLRNNNSFSGSNNRRGGQYNGNHYYRGTKEDGSDTRKYRGGGRGSRDSRDSK